MSLIDSKQLANSGTPLETGEIILLPEGGVPAAQATRADALTYQGGTQVLRRSARMSRLLFQLTAVTLPVTARVLLYQGAQGGSGTASKVASANFVAAAAGSQSVTLVFEQGLVTFAPGIVYCLWGRASAGGSFTMRAYGTNAYAGLNTAVDANVHPTVFSTALLASAADPATIDPLVTLVAATTDSNPVFRMRA